MLQKAISSSFRHGLNLKAGELNAAKGDCVLQATISYIENRTCFINKLTESDKEFRIKCIKKAQNEADLIPCKYKKRHGYLRME